MDIGAIFLLLALLLAVGLFIAQPLTERRARRIAVETHELSTLMAERERIINALQELDFDYILGKIPAEDYPTQRASLLQKGAQILRQLDALPSPNEKGAGGEGMSAEARLEAASASRRADAAAFKSQKAADGSLDDKLEALIAARLAARKEK